MSLTDRNFGALRDLVSDLLTRPMAARGKSHLSRAPTTPNV
jgi:hypothetical protein